MNLSAGTLRECKTLFDGYKLLQKLNKVVPFPKILRETTKHNEVFAVPFSMSAFVLVDNVLFIKNKVADSQNLCRHFAKMST